MSPGCTSDSSGSVPSGCSLSSPETVPVPSETASSGSCPSWLPSGCTSDSSGSVPSGCSLSSAEPVPSETVSFGLCSSCTAPNCSSAHTGSVFVDRVPTATTQDSPSASNRLFVVLFIFALLLLLKFCFYNSYVSIFFHCSQLINRTYFIAVTNKFISWKVLKKKFL